VTEKQWNIINGDCVTEMHAMADRGDLFDLAVFSPPFASLFTYSNLDQDMGNSRDSDDEFLMHHRFFVDALIRVVRPGRNVCVHVQNPTRTKATHGHMGIWDMRGDMIRQYQQGGFVFYGDITVDKCPQAQAIRTKAHALMFVNLEKDSMISRPALADYVLIFKRPGVNATPVHPVQNGEMTRETWIEWARPIWRGIKETNTLNVRLAREEEDERHLCPLQLDLIERCVRLWSNRGETVFSPFAGVGSEGYVAVQLGRRFVGTELKPAYASRAQFNMAEAVRIAQSPQADMFGERPVSFHV